VRMLVPPIAQRREIDRKLSAYFYHYRPGTFRQAISDFCRFYGVKRPRIEWYEYIDWGRTAGRTFEDGRIHLVHPENWKRGRIYKSERMWVQTVYHELGHYVFWTDAERKAEVFTLRMVRGLKRSQRRPRATVRLSRASTSRSARRPGRRGTSAGGRGAEHVAVSRQHPAPIRARRRRSTPRYRAGVPRSDGRRVSRH
jgi:hypothetical protein